MLLLSDNNLWLLLLFFPPDSEGKSAPNAVVAVPNVFNRKNAKIGLKSNPKMGGMRPLNRLRYGSVIAKMGCKMPIPWACGNQDNKIRPVITKL
jgi:hypothetical protein